MTQEQSMEIELKFESDGLALAGVLHMPEKEQPPLAVGSHGLFADGDSPKQIAMAEACNQRGLAYFRFHHRGCGKSEGEFNRVTTVPGRVNDMLAAIEVLQARDDIGQGLGLFGSSLGGAVCLATVQKLPVDCLVTYAAPADPGHLLEILKKDEQGKKLPQEFFDTAHALDLNTCAAPLQNILVFHGSADEVVPVSNAYAIYEAAVEPKKIIVLEDGDHPVSHPGHRRVLIMKASQWLAEHLA